MITWGFIPSYGDVVTVDQDFTINGLTICGAYILVTGASGNIVWENAQGNAQYLPNAQSGQVYLLGARKILSSGTVNGTNRTTSATGLAWLGINPLYNTP